MFRIVSDTSHPDTPIVNATTGTKERVSKLKSVATGHSLTAVQGGVTRPAIAVPQGVISYAISAKSKGAEDKVFASLGRLVHEDPTLTLSREPFTGEFLLTGRGELHIRTTVQKLQRMFGVQVERKLPKVLYRETITKITENVEGKLKKQSGGNGMFGVCSLTVEPLERGEGIVCLDETVGGAIPRNRIPAVEKGVRKVCTSGLKAALEPSQPTRLERVMQRQVHVPDSCVGDVTRDLSSRRGRAGSDPASGAQHVIDAQVPLSEVFDCASTLTSITADQGEFQMELSHYAEAPASVRQKLIIESGSHLTHA